MITLDDWMTSKGRYKERKSSPELTSHVMIQASMLLEKVNKALEFLEVKTIDISSGFRPSAANRAAGGASLSKHRTGEAIDLIDDAQQSLAKKFTIEVLEKFDLYREDYDYTKGKRTNWVHLQSVAPRSGRRVFKP